MFKIFADTHKIIAKNIHENIFNIYGLKLDKSKLLWGSIAPDILPQYRLRRHYKQESLNYVVKEISKLILISKYININPDTDPLMIKLLSSKIGIISHYLSDFVCLPHAERWTFMTNNVFKHINYESKLNEYSPYHDFKRNIITVEDMDAFQEQTIKLNRIVKTYIKAVIEEYSLKTGYKRDLNFALSLNLRVCYFIIDTINAYNEEMHRSFAFEF